MIIDWDTDRKYSIIYADPPWHYNSRSPHKKTRFGGGVNSNYETMANAGIAKLQVGKLAANDSVIAMWTTGPHIHVAKSIIEAWGFKYVETVLFVWVKTNPKRGNVFYGPGYYTGSNAEYVMLGKRGKPKIKNRGVSQIIMEPHPRDENGKIIHSRKPSGVRDKLITLFGDVPRVELFARECTDGWDSLGNQL
jgi:site-specific DNA-methyltransferase (adenine-specific)